MVSFQRGQYAPGNIVAVVAGALPQEAVEGALIAAMGDMVPLTISAYTPAPAPQPGPRVVVARREIEQANICLAVPARPYLHPDRYVQLLLDTVLGAGMSSRLFQTVREERALAYNIYSAVRQHADAGALVIYAGVSPARAPECLSAIWAEMERLAGEEVDPGELARAKEYNKGRILLRMEDSYGVASWYGGQELLLQRVEEVDAVIARIEAVQPADLHRLAQELFHRQAIHLAAVGPFADEAPLRRALGV
jgi:predicted Zn-dependent peptidase